MAVAHSGYRLAYVNLYSALVDKPRLQTDFSKYNEGPQSGVFAFVQPLVPV